MTPAQDPLAALAPLREPPDPGWWPPAPGWWLLAGLLVFVVCAGAALLWRRHQRRRPRREALRRLRQLREELQDDGDFQLACNRLLKAVALRSFAPRRVAALNGEAWCQFLNDSAPARQAPFTPGMLADLYAREPSAPVDREALYRATRQWIRTHREAS